MKYIIATDYDGTLFQYHKGGISEKVVKAIREFRSKGNLFGVVSGRCYKWTYPVFKKEGLFDFDFIISNGGAQCCDINGDFIFSDKISKSGFARSFVEKLFSMGAEECGITFEKSRFNFSPSLPDGEGAYSPFSSLDSCNEVSSAHGVFCDSDEAVKAENILLAEFSDIINIARNDRCLDVTAKGVNKATGIGKYAGIMGVSYENIYVAGDNYNDLPMIKAYHGCAVSNAVDELKKSAEYVLDDLSELVEIILCKEN